MNKSERIAQGAIPQLHQRFLRASLPAVSHAHDVIIEYLTAQQQRGVEHVFLTNEARATLRELQEQSRIKPRASSVAAGTPQELPAPPPVIMGGGDKAAQLASLAQQISAWGKSLNANHFRPKLVFSTGNLNAELMIVGESPNYEDEKKGAPFAGETGEKLDQILKVMGLTREQIYLTNLSKFRPKTANQTTNNRAINADEARLFMPWLKAECAIIQPKVILAAGENVARFLLENEQSTSLRTAWHRMDGVALRATFHPSCLLSRDTHDFATKRPLWEDMLAVMEHLGMPITEKHRGYFLPKK